MVLVPSLGRTPPELLQLDTGADRSVVYGVEHPRTVGVFRDLFVAAEARPDLSEDALPGGARVVGTAGTDALEGRVLVFDAPRRLLCAVQDLGATLVLRSRYAFGKIFVTVNVGADALEQVAFDTGAQFDLVVDPPDFERFTGRTVDDVRNLRLPVHAWGQELSVVVAPSGEEVAVGELRLGKVDVATVPATPDMFSRVRRFRLRGLLGWPALARQRFAVSLL
jgi:hypothetical protein